MPSQHSHSVQPLSSLCDRALPISSWSMAARGSSNRRRRPRPTLIVLHVRKARALPSRNSTKLDTLAPQQGFVAVFPDELRQQWNFFPPGKLDLFCESKRRTKKMFQMMLRPARIADAGWIAGESNGGLMTLRMICTDSNLFAGAALLGSAMRRPSVRIAIRRVQCLLRSSGMQDANAALCRRIDRAK